MTAAGAPSLDVVVVGGGAAGSALSARLSEDPDRRVLLLEAGRAPDTRAGYGARLRDAGVVPGAGGDDDAWVYDARLTADRDYRLRRGRVLGGSTAANGAYFMRARPADFAAWAAAGGSAWSYDRVLPLLRRLEADADHGASPVHGDAGPMPVRRDALDHPAAAALHAAALAAGIPDEPDKNAGGVAGVGPVPRNAVDGVRVNAGIAYVLPALARPNLRVRGGCRVLRVVVSGGRATGVEVDDGSGGVERIAAGEVVLCAGAIESARLLQLSGIGPADLLRAAGVPVRVAATGVGSAVSDHMQIPLELVPARPLPRPAGAWMGASVNLDAHGPTGAPVEVLQSLVPIAALAGAPAPDDAPLPLLVSVRTAEPRETIRIRSADPAAPVALEYRYLERADDRSALRAAVRLALDLVARPELAGVASGVSGIAGPRSTAGVHADDDDALDRFIADRIGTSVHACGSAPLGPQDDPRAVVDGAGRVHGVAGLRVADTSILPTVPARGPALTAVLVGELVADAILGG